VSCRKEGDGRDGPECPVPDAKKGESREQKSRESLLQFTLPPPTKQSFKKYVKTI
jgi:hypothetical protein